LVRQSLAATTSLKALMNLSEHGFEGNLKGGHLQNKAPRSQ
jgi:hypothetical protein